LNIQVGAYNQEASWVTEQLQDRAISHIKKHPIIWEMKRTIASISNWDRHLMAGFSETYEQSKLFQNQKYYDFLYGIDAMSSGIWSLLWREQAFKTL